MALVNNSLSLANNLTLIDFGVVQGLSSCILVSISESKIDFARYKWSPLLILCVSSLEN